MARKEKPVAVIAPSVRSIKLYADGRIEYQGKSGSIIGATARLEKSGEHHGLHDTRKVMLMIEGPSVDIAAPLPVAAFKLHVWAEEFVTQVNEMSTQLDGSPPAPIPAPAPAEQSAPDPPTTINRSTPVDNSVPPASDAHQGDLQSMDVLIGQLERLGKLRDSQVLTEDEFQEQKAALLRAARNSRT
jgi:hypothetical protein